MLPLLSSVLHLMMSLDVLRWYYVDGADDAAAGRGAYDRLLLHPVI